jgi:hypothetical protein
MNDEISIFNFDYLLSDRLNQIKLISLLIDNLNYLSINLIKHIVSACNETIQRRIKMTQIEQSLNNKIFQEQSNDICKSFFILFIFNTLSLSTIKKLITNK